MTSRSKTTYQGQQLSRITRSELEDNTMRDQARHKSKLNENLKTVERAKNVMIKSMEADKELFLRSGAQTKGKMSKSQSPQTAPRQPPTSQTSRLVSDSRLRRTTSESSTASGKSSSTARSGPSSSSQQRQQQQQQQPATNDRAAKPQAAGSDIQIPDLDSGSIYDKFLADNTNSSNSRTTTKTK